AGARKLVAAARPPARIDGAITVLVCRAGRRPSGAPRDSANHRWSLTQAGHFFMTKSRASLRSDNCPTSIGMSVRFELEQVSDFVGMRIMFMHLQSNPQTDSRGAHIRSFL